MTTAKPFEVDTRLKDLSEPYPEAKRFYEILSQSSRRGREILVRLWLTEGIPFAFRECPAIYEELRGWLGYRLEVHPKQIALLGSSRIGFSMARPPEFGRDFGKHSDLDFVVVSLDLFCRFEKTFNEFKQHLINNEVSPRNAREQAFWESNIEFGKRNLPLGFFDADKLPYLDRYPAAQHLGQAMWLVIKKIKVTDKAPCVNKASVRVYKNWQSLINRVSLNLFWTFKN
jgi:hypothetical protein